MSTSPSEYRFSDQIGHLLRRAYQRHVAIFKQTVPDSQLTAAQFVVHQDQVTHHAGRLLVAMKHQQRAQFVARVQQRRWPVHRPGLPPFHQHQAQATVTPLQLDRPEMPSSNKRTP